MKKQEFLELVNQHFEPLPESSTRSFIDYCNGEISEKRILCDNSWAHSNFCSRSDCYSEEWKFNIICDDGIIPVHVWHWDNLSCLEICSALWEALQEIEENLKWWMDTFNICWYQITSIDLRNDRQTDDDDPLAWNGKVMTVNFIEKWAR